MMHTTLKTPEAAYQLRINRLYRFAYAASMFSTGIGAVVLVGWILRVPGLVSVLPWLPQMHPDTALSFLALGAALWLRLRAERGGATAKYSLRAAQSCAGAIIVLGTLKLAVFFWPDYSAVFDPTILDPFQLFPEIATIARMAASTALNFILFSVALLILGVEIGPSRRPSEWLSLAAGVIALQRLLVYVYYATIPTAFAATAGMSVLTALTGIVIAAGILCAHPDRGWMAQFTGNSLGSSMLRRLLPGIALITFMLSLLRVAGEQAGLYGSYFGISLFVVSMNIVFSIFVCWIAATLNAVEARKKQAEQIYVELFEHSPDASLAVNSKGEIVLTNSQVTLFFGYTQEELLGQPVEMLVPLPHRSGHKIEQAQYNENPKPRPMGPTQEMHGRRKDGSQFPIRVSLTPVQTAEGRLVFAAIRDITSREESMVQIRRLNDTLELRVAQRTAELEAINKELEAYTYSVSHDLRAPLRHIDGFSRILLDDFGPQLPLEAQRFVERIRTGVQNMGSLIDDLMALSRVARADAKLQVTGLNSLVESALEEVKREAGDRQIEWKISSLPFVECDPALLKQVFINLLSNAVKYTRPREQAVIEVGQRDNGRENTMFVRDNGIGFSMKYADKLFGVFQRLHRQEDFEGTGIGLATVQRIVHKHGGKIWAEAELDRGATFYFTLGPGVPGDAEQPPTPKLDETGVTV